MKSNSCPRCGAPLSSLSPEEFACEFCGERIKIEKAPQNNIPQQEQPVIQKEIVYVKEESYQEDDYREDEPLGVGMWILCILIPLVGLGSFFYYKSNDYLKKGNQALLAGFIGFILAWILLY